MLTNSREGYAEDWGSSFDDLDAEYWESYFDGPDESEVETCYQGEGCYEDDYCEDDYYEDLYEEDIDQVEDNREIYFQSIRDEYFGHEPEIEIMTSLAYAPPMSDSFYFAFKMRLISISNQSKTGVLLVSFPCATGQAPAVR
jgi:hypothetical protein